MEFKSLHLVCSLCKCFGHRTWDCPLVKQRVSADLKLAGKEVVSKSSPVINVDVLNSNLKGGNLRGGGDSVLLGND